jgi:hypothetical protein
VEDRQRPDLADPGGRRAEVTAWNASRLPRDASRGFYESYFLRANHPSRPLALWIRYTAFCPRGRPGDACGELWAIVFDGEAGRTTAVKEAVPLSDCTFSPTGLDVRIGSATLTDGALQGRATSPSHRVEWTLRYSGSQPPLLLLAESLYERSLPKAKAVVGLPNAVYSGTVTVDGTAIAIEGWTGSQNHNWGTQHTDRYAWAQVAGFDNAPDAFLECSTAQVRIGPLWSPPLTLVVLRDQGQEMALNGILRAMRASGTWDFFTWTIESRTPRVRISGRIHAPATAFVGLTYANPPGGEKTCLNTKLASAAITMERPGHAPRTLVTKHRAAFEILTDRRDHGVSVVL